MKKLLCLFLSLVLLSTSYVAYGQSSWGGWGWWGGGWWWSSWNGVITLYPWWNVVSTPYILSSLSFSNNWNWISFSKLQNWQWVDVVANTTNIKPLEWFMVYNNNSENVTLTLTRKTDVEPTAVTLQKNLNYWWDLLWITTTNSPFSNIWTPAVMSLDFTSDWTTNNRNKVIQWGNYATNHTSSNVNGLQLWEAYWIFINQQNAVYWWVNGWGNWWSWGWWWGSGDNECWNPFSQEEIDGYNYAYSKGMTSVSSLENAWLCDLITRVELAKAVVAWADDQGMTPDTSKACAFTDTSSLDNDSATAVVKACQLGIMWQWVTQFRPYENISKAEFWTLLSRMLRGSQYEWWTPYYANHLNALKAAGIMNQIANAETTIMLKKDIFILLMRATNFNWNQNNVDCTDPIVALACAVGSDCPIACREYSLTINYSHTNNQKVLIGKKSDMDSISFNYLYGERIEEITFKKYWNAELDDIDTIWLEDSQWNKIANEKVLDIYWKQTLEIHDLVNIWENSPITLVVKTKSSMPVWDDMIWFKITNIETDKQSFAFDNDDVPYLFSTVRYGWTASNTDESAIRIIPKWQNKTYNREAWEYYEIGKFSISSVDNNVLLGWFDLTNSWDLVLSNSNSDIKVSVDWEYVDGLVTSISNSKLVINFDEIEIRWGNAALVTVETKLNNFNQLWKALQYSIANANDVRISEDVEPTTSWVVVSFDNTEWSTYTFEWGKVKFTNTALWNVEAPQQATDVEVARWNIEITEPIVMSFDITAENTTWINSLRVALWWNWWDEFEATKEISGSNTIFKFRNVEIENSWRISFQADIRSDAEIGSPIRFTTLSHSIITAEYSNSDLLISDSSIVWSISFSKLTVVQPKASLQNNITKIVEFPLNESSEKVVFDWTYLARKWDIYLNEIIIEWTKGSDWNDIMFYLYIDWEPVADIRNLWSSETFDTVTVKGWDSVNIKIWAQVEANAVATYSDLSITLKWEDVNWNYPVGVATANLVTMKIIEATQPTIQNYNFKDTVFLKAANQKIADFYIKPNNSNDTLNLKEIVLWWDINWVALTPNDITLSIDWVTVTSNSLTYDDINETVDSLWVNVKIYLKNAITWDVTLNIIKINGINQNKTIKSKFVDAAVYITAQKDLGWTTKFTVSVDKFGNNSNNISVSNLKIYADSEEEPSINYNQAFEDWDTFEAKWDAHNAKYVTKVVYDVSNWWQTETVEISKTDYIDYFKIDADYIKIFKAD